MKKKLLKKCLTICASLAMIVAMALPVFALDDSNTANIKINGLEGNGGVLEFYQVIDVEGFENGTPKAPFYTWNNNVVDFVKKYDESNKTNYIDEKNNVTDSFMKLTKDADLKPFVDALASFIRTPDPEDSSKEIKETKSVSIENVTDEKSLKVSDNKPGAYLILIEGGVRIYSPAFVAVYPKLEKNVWTLGSNPIDVNEKSNDPSIEKTLVGNDLTVKIGDTVTYRLNVTLPDYPANALNKQFTISDQLPDGLSLIEDSVKFYAKNDYKESLTINGIFTPTVSKKGFSYALATDKYDNLKNLVEGNNLYVEYQATVNSSAFNSESLCNTANLNYNKFPYSNNGEYVNKTDSEQLYTYGLQIIKQALGEDGNLLNNQSVVNGVTFNLYKTGDENPLKFKVDTSGYYYLDSTGSSDLVISGAEDNVAGKLLIKGLDLGDYTLKETKAPAGYAIPKDAVATFTLDDKGEVEDQSTVDGTLDHTTAEGTNIAKENGAIISKNQLNLTIVNYKNNFNLPNTGDIGTRIFTYVGIALMSGSLILLVVAKKRKEQ